jgi:hypothetical protein
MPARNVLDLVFYDGVDSISGESLDEQEPCFCYEISDRRGGKHPEYAVDGEWVCEHHYNTWLEERAEVAIVCEGCSTETTVRGVAEARSWLKGHFDVIGEHGRYPNTLHEGLPEDSCARVMKGRLIFDVDVIVLDSDCTGWVRVDFDQVDSASLVDG